MKGKKGKFYLGESTFGSGIKKLLKECEIRVKKNHKAHNTLNRHL